jgi:hypothetical protein
VNFSLSKPERATLSACEAVIERGLDTFVEVGNALLRIRKERLYRAEFKTFEEYCRKRWQMSHQRADQLIKGAEIAENLTTNVVISEGALRPLASLPPAKQREAWQSAVDSSPTGKPTAKEVAHEVSKIVPMSILPAPAKPARLDGTEFGLQYAEQAIAALSQIAPYDLQREAAFDKVENWIAKNRRKRRTA